MMLNYGYVLYQCKPGYMKRWFLFIWLINFSFIIQAQNPGLGPIYNNASEDLHNADSLRHALAEAKEDSVRVDLLIRMTRLYEFQQKRDSAFWNTQEALDLAQKINYLRGQFGARTTLASLFTDAGNYTKALDLVLTNLRIAEKYNDTPRIFHMNRFFCFIYIESRDFQKVLSYARKNQQLLQSGFLESKKDITLYKQMGYENFLAEAFDRLDQLDSALYYRRLSYEAAVSLKNNQSLAVAAGGLARTLSKTRRYQEAYPLYFETISYARSSGREDVVAESYLGLAEFFHREKQIDSSFYYGRLAFDAFHRFMLPSGEMNAASFLSKIHAEKDQFDSAYKYQLTANSFKDSLFNQEKTRQLQNITFNEGLRESQILDAKREAQREYQTRIKLYSLAGVLAVLLLIAFILFRNNRQKQEANILLKQQKEMVESTLSQLKSAQSQLVQSEKMASLGELTAGIAHEIQNPLNFVNNFSDVNTELVDELQQELKSGKIDNAISISNDIKENEQKINHHGKRADAIVKGMLQHSRTSSGQKEPTDINALADEYLRLAYHGLRAKDKSFNVAMKTDFDESIGKINIIPQEIGRVVLNLINNAFYAVHEKRKEIGESYEPVVSIGTRNVNSKAEISVKDNGNGIPQKILDKIFHPFFTTKPTGQGTGLGLSLSYDIVKAHGGEIKVNTKEGEGSEFIIQLRTN
jgi:two-component system NtrC family sensor kinase